MRIFVQKAQRLETHFLLVAVVHHMLGQFEEAERLFLEDVKLSQEMGLNGHLALFMEIWVICIWIWIKSPLPYCIFISVWNRPTSITHS